MTRAVERARVGPADDSLGSQLASRAELRRNIGRYREALADYQEALARAVEPATDLLYEIGRTYMDLDDAGKDARAVDAFSRAIALAPDMDRAYVGRALAAENLGDLAAAAADLDIVLPRMPSRPLLLEKRGLWRLRLGRPADALADLAAAAALGHEPVDVMTGRAVAVQQLGDEAAALAALNATVDRYPEAVVARTHRAAALLAAGEVGAARADLDRIVAHSADHWKAPVAFSLRAILRAEERDLAGAVADLEQAVARAHPTPPTEWVGLLADLRNEARAEAACARGAGTTDEPVQRTSCAQEPLGPEVSAGTVQHPTEAQTVEIHEA